MHGKSTMAILAVSFALGGCISVGGEILDTGTSQYPGHNPSGCVAFTTAAGTSTYSNVMCPAGGGQYAVTPETMPSGGYIGPTYGRQVGTWSFDLNKLFEKKERQK